jgi:hypothetical protein
MSLWDDFSKSDKINQKINLVVVQFENFAPKRSA